MARVKITPHNFKGKFLLSSNTKMKLTNITIYQHRVNVINIFIKNHLDITLSGKI